MCVCVCKCVQVCVCVGGKGGGEEGEGRRRRRWCLCVSGEGVGKGGGKGGGGKRGVARSSLVRRPSPGSGDNVIMMHLNEILGMKKNNCFFMKISCLASLP